MRNTLCYRRCSTLKRQTLARECVKYILYVYIYILLSYLISLNSPPITPFAHSPATNKYANRSLLRTRFVPTAMTATARLAHYANNKIINLATTANRPPRRRRYITLIYNKSIVSCAPINPRLPIYNDLISRNVRRLRNGRLI